MKKIRKRPKLGDVLYTKVPNGYKIYQWVFKDTRWGSLVYVFPGLYDELPPNIPEIIENQNGFIMSMPVGKACRIGFSEIINNYPVPNYCTFPKYCLDWYDITIKGEPFFTIKIKDFETLKEVACYHVKSIDDLPDEHSSVNLISGCYSADWILYLFDIDFNLHRLGEELIGDNSEKYADLFREILNKAQTD